MHATSCTSSIPSLRIPSTQESGADPAGFLYQGKEVWRADPATTGIFDGVTTTRYGAFQVKTIPNQRDE